MVVFLALKEAPKPKPAKTKKKEPVKQPPVPAAPPTKTAMTSDPEILEVSLLVLLSLNA